MQQGARIPPGMGPKMMSGGYKTSLCKNYMESGICSFGTKCNFAHGPMELRSPPGGNMMGPGPMMPPGPPMMGPPGPHSHNPKYKTSMCSSVSSGTPCTRGMS